MWGRTPVLWPFGTSAACPMPAQASGWGHFDEDCQLGRLSRAACGNTVVVRSVGGAMERLPGIGLPILPTGHPTRSTCVRPT